MTKQDIVNMKPGRELDKLVAESLMGIIPEPDRIGSYIDSSNIWTIIDIMIKKHFHYTLSNSDDKHTCVFDSIDTHRRYIVHSNSPVEAVCKAALLVSLDEGTIK